MRISPTGILIKNSGFTLVELLVVLIILSLTSLISLPLLVDQDDSQEKQKLRRIAGTVKQLYNEATLTRDEHLLVFDFERNSLSAFRMRNGDGSVIKEPFGHEVLLTPLQVRQVEVEGRGSFSNGQVSIRIFPLGWMDAARIELNRKSGTGIQLAFSPLTGTTTINAESPRL